jgi:hypothetical protein
VTLAASLLPRWACRPPAITSALHPETKGNTLFVGEAIRLLAAEEKLRSPDPATFRVAVPKGITDAIGHRLRHSTSRVVHLIYELAERKARGWKHPRTFEIPNGSLLFIRHGGRPPHRSLRDLAARCGKAFREEG